MIEIKEIENKEMWEGFLRCQENKTFLQSWNWGQFQQKLGEKVWRFGIFEGENLLAVCLVILVKARRGKFLLVPHGPVIKVQSLEILLRKLKEIAKEEKCSFIRMATVWKRSEENKKLFQNLGFQRAPLHTHPELTWVLDLKPSENELLQKMRKTTRYLIRQAEKNPDLKIVKSYNIEDIKIFNQLYQETVKRHHFTPFSLNYLEQEFLSFSQDNGAVIFLAKCKNDYLAAAVVLYWQGIGFYHQGASVNSKVPAAYLMQWEAIKEAKIRGCAEYNFWGVADSSLKLRGHPWAGLSLFKMGFGGSERAYLPTQDLPLSWRYWPIRWFERLRKMKRGL